MVQICYQICYHLSIHSTDTTKKKAFQINDLEGF